ncbi:peroxiredoxin [Arthrobacter cryoconiti]|uniref:thioredoxin-dependent peroxiredoxin n=1 Tax=Arthrobacter cryoconiti TaxID=748907 RepID=A0ABV8QW99_9MICC|nr:peroxiredoxin [Arthrobacter cryoconiti]MCC9068777.1 peroxiredoxin [Arthrobacter cryoconiti]
MLFPATDDAGPAQGVKLGEVAPDFSLANQFGEPISLSGLRGSPVVLVFYPFAFSGICTGELCQLSENLADFQARGVRLLAISVDSKYTLRSYARAEGFTFDLLADFWPHGEVASRYGVFDAQLGMAGRSTFALDRAGVVRDSFSTPTGQARSLERYRQSLAAL